MIRSPLNMSSAITVAFAAGAFLGTAATAFTAGVLGSSVFSDIPAGAYYDEAVGEMYSDGIIKGNPDGTFNPRGYVSRADIAVMFQRFKDSLDGTATATRSSSSASKSSDSPSSSSSTSSSSSSSSSASVATTNPAGIFRFTTSTFSVVENVSVGTVNITIVRTGGNQGIVAVDYAVTGNTATAGSDFEAISGTLTFANKETSKTFTVKILNDTSTEGTETATVTLSKPTNSAIIGAPSSAAISINDDEAGSSSSSTAIGSSSSANPSGTLSFSAVAYGVLENGGSLTVTVNRNGGSTGTAGVNYATANGTGRSGNDYTATTGTLSFAAGETSKTFSVPITDDSSVDGATAFSVTLSSPTGGANMGTASATVTIYDNESATAFGTGSLKFAKSAYDALEGDKKVDITIQRVGGTKGTVSVNYSTTNGTAGSGTDYTATSGTMTFQPGEASKIVSIPLVDDSVVESSDTLYIDLASPTANATLLSPYSATITISD